jgi:hypothetical protein
MTDQDPAPFTKDVDARYLIDAARDNFLRARADKERMLSILRADGLVRTSFFVPGAPDRMLQDLPPAIYAQAKAFFAAYRARARAYEAEGRAIRARLDALEEMTSAPDPQNAPLTTMDRIRALLGREQGVRRVEEGDPEEVEDDAPPGPRVPHTGRRPREDGHQPLPGMAVDDDPEETNAGLDPRPAKKSRGTGRRRAPRKKKV